MRFLRKLSCSTLKYVFRNASNTAAMSKKCAVPKCKSSATSGVSFPKDPKILEKWLNALRITKFTPAKGDFVCIEHFRRKAVKSGVENENAEKTLLPENSDSSGDDNDDEEAQMPTEKEVSKGELSENAYMEEEPVPSTSSCSGVMSQDGNFRIQNNQNYSYNSYCRLCMSFEGEYGINRKLTENSTIQELITACIPEINFSRTDQLSKLICKRCLKILQDFHEFKNTCIELDTKQHQMVSEKRKGDDLISEIETKKPKLTKEEYKALHFEKVFNLKQKRQPVPEDVKNNVKKFEPRKKSIIQTINLPHLKEEESIIIKVLTDEEVQQEEQLAKQQKSKPGRISKFVKVKIPEAENRSILRPVCGTMTSVPLTDPKLCVVQEDHPEDGYCIIEDYVFVHLLCKGKLRNLRCLIRTCHAVAQQKLICKDTYEDQVQLLITHNHPSPNPVDKKKQIFIHQIMRALQSNKSADIQGVYDTFRAKFPEISDYVSLKNVIDEMCSFKDDNKRPKITSFAQFYNLIESDVLQKLHFMKPSIQFYQEKFSADDGTKAVLFGNSATVAKTVDSYLMFVDDSFIIDTLEPFKYQLITVLVLVQDKYYPLIYAFISKKSEEIYKLIFQYIRDTYAPSFRPDEIITSFDSCIFYTLAETYPEARLGGSTYYYALNLYKKVCALNLARKLETDTNFRTVYHLLVMLPLLPANTIADGLSNIEMQADSMGLGNTMEPIFQHVKSEWMTKVTPDLFSAHRLEGRINETVVVPFKKLRDYLMLYTSKNNKQFLDIVALAQRLIELEIFIENLYLKAATKGGLREFCGSQKRSVLRAWQFIESHPRINMNNFFSKVMGFVKGLENQLWIWGFYRFKGDPDEELINAADFATDDSKEEHHDHNYEQPIQNEEDAEVLDDKTEDPSLVLSSLYE